MFHRIVPLTTGLLLTACSQPPTTDVTGRIWLSKDPAGPRDPFTAFAVVPGPGPAQPGAYHHGSVFEGSYATFAFAPRGRGRAELRFLQDGRTVVLAFRPCRPTKGHDACLEVDGDPYGVRRYESRRRWRFPRRGDEATDPVVAFHQALAAEAP